MLEGKALRAGCMRYWTCRRIGRIPKTTRRSNRDWDRPALAAFLHITTGPSWQWSPTRINYKENKHIITNYSSLNWWLILQITDQVLFSLMELLPAWLQGLQAPCTLARWPGCSHRSGWIWTASLPDEDLLPQRRYSRSRQHSGKEKREKVEFHYDEVSLTFVFFSLITHHNDN